MTLQAPEAARKIPRGLATHRGTLAAATVTSDELRERLACTVMADVTRYQLQEFMDAMRKEGREPATLQLERALVRRLFNYASGTWHWSAPADNPATKLTLPTVKNERDRVMSDSEQQRLDEAIHACRNALVGPTVTLLTETAMRSSEPLQYARWQDVDWDAKVLNLVDSKTDKRSVPLSPKAIEALRTLQKSSPGEPGDPIVRISYESLKAAWGRACERAGLTDLHIHDLRHTAATRMALKTGNIFLVQALTGHQTLSQLARYPPRWSAGGSRLVRSGYLTCANCRMCPAFSLLPSVMSDWLSASSAISLTTSCSPSLGMNEFTSTTFRRRLSRSSCGTTPFETESWMELSTAALFIRTAGTLHCSSSVPTWGWMSPPGGRLTFSRQCSLLALNGSRNDVWSTSVSSCPSGPNGTSPVQWNPRVTGGGLF